MNLTHIILGLGAYLFPINAFSKKKPAMRHAMSKFCVLKFRCYAALMVDLNGCLSVFPGSDGGNKKLRQNSMNFCYIAFPRAGVRRIFYKAFILRR